MFTVIDQARPWLMPSKALGAYNPRPRRPVSEDERDWKADEPSRDQHGLAGESIRQQAGGEIDECLDQAEGDDEREDDDLGADPELLGTDQGDDRALQAHHPAHERVDEDQQPELRPVLAQAEPNWLIERCHQPTLSSNES
jgi:hypothetical protein